MNHRHTWRSGLLLAAALTFTLPAQADLFVFGDSLSDAGNVWDASKSTPGLAPDPIVPPYYQGRMSNGKNWADYVAQDLGLGQTTASRIGGNNYAWAGATTGAGTSNRKSIVIPGQIQAVDNIGKQITTFTTDHGTFNGDDLVMYWGGANDMLYYALGGVPVATAIGHLTSLTRANLQSLESLGAVKIVLPNQIDSAKTPIWNGHYGLPAALQPYLTALTKGFNAALPGLIADLESSSGFDADIVLVDIYKKAESIIADPSAYGLTDVTTPAFLAGAANPDDYLFWDPVHPTTIGHRLIADSVVAALIPEPEGWLLLVTGLALIGYRPRRRACHPACS